MRMRMRMCKKRTCLERQGDKKQKNDDADDADDADDYDDDGLMDRYVGLG